MAYPACVLHLVHAAVCTPAIRLGPPPYNRAAAPVYPAVPIRLQQAQMLTYCRHARWANPTCTAQCGMHTAQCGAASQASAPEEDDRSQHAGAVHCGVQHLGVEQVLQQAHVEAVAARLLRVQQKRNGHLLAADDSAAVVPAQQLVDEALRYKAHAWRHVASQTPRAAWCMRGCMNEPSMRRSLPATSTSVPHGVHPMCDPVQL